MSDSNIIPGTPQWEKICQQCGLCCLVKYADAAGNFYLTRVMCDHMNPETGKCDCYSTDVARRGDEQTGCRAHNGSVLNLDTLRNDYVVPGCCPYVKKFVGQNRLKLPKIQYNQLIRERDMVGNIQDYIIADSWRLFKYNPHVNKRMRELLQKTK